MSEPMHDEHPHSLTCTHRRRMTFVRFVFLLAFAGVAARLVQVQLMPDPRYLEKDEGAGHVGYSDIVHPRGCIYDIQGRTLAHEGRVPSVWANPSRIADPSKYLVPVSTALGMPQDEMYELLTREKTVEDEDGTDTGKETLLGLAETPHHR